MQILMITLPSAKQSPITLSKRDTHAHTHGLLDDILSCIEFSLKKKAHNSAQFTNYKKKEIVLRSCSYRNI